MKTALFDSEARSEEQQRQAKADIAAVRQDLEGARDQIKRLQAQLTAAEAALANSEHQRTLMQVCPPAADAVCAAVGAAAAAGGDGGGSGGGGCGGGGGGSARPSSNPYIDECIGNEKDNAGNGICLLDEFVEEQARHKAKADAAAESSTPETVSSG